MNDIQLSTNPAVDGDRSTRPTAALLLSEGANRDLLERELDGIFHIRVGCSRLDDPQVDLAIADVSHLKRHRSSIRNRKEADAEVFFPVLLLTADRDLASRRFRAVDLVDDVIGVPVTRTELRLRLRLVERALEYSNTAARRNRELSRSNQRLATLATAVREAPDHVIITDADGTVRYVNAQFEERLEYTSERAVGRPYWELLGPDYGPSSRDETWSGLRDGEVRREEGTAVTRSGRRFPQELTIAPVHDADGELLHVVIAGTDISARKAHENELIQARRHAEEMSALKSVFLANMSHEIRTPLASIIGFADLLAEKAPDALQEFVTLIRDSGRRLLITLNSVLDLAQLESDSLIIRPVEMEVDAVVRETVEALSPQAQKKGLVLDVEGPEEPVLAVMDRGVVTRTVTNLVQNAIKFTHEGHITVTLGTDEDELVIEVADTGVGMAEEELPHLFDAFRQESTGMEREFEGSGLGLTITQRLTDLVEGSIAVESEKGKGTTFTVRLPRRLERNEETPSLEDAHQWGLDALPGDQRVLAVDDDPSMLEIIEEMLPGSFQVDTASDPETALRRARENTYDLVLLDINLKEDRNGIDVLDELRTIGGIEDALMIAVTAYALPGDGESFHEAGFDGYVAKPFTRETLRENLIQVL